MIFLVDGIQWQIYDRGPEDRPKHVEKVFHLEQIDFSFSCVCPVIDHKFRRNIVKVAVDPRGGRIARSRSLTRRINFKFICLSAY